MRFFKIILFILTLIVSPLAFAGGITKADENQLGADFFKQLNQRKIVLEDPIVTDALQKLAYQLVTHSSAPQQVLHVFVVKSAGINAFAVPGGYIGINAGLIEAATSEGELAAVLAHEIAHITQRHYARGRSGETQAQLSTIAAMLAAVALGGSQAGSAAAVGVMAGSAQLFLNYSREQEREADSVGMDMMSKAGFDPQNMVVFFKRLYQKTDSFFETISTHPMATSRIADIRNKLFNAPHQTYPAPNPTFQLIRERVIVDTSTHLPELIASDHARLSETKNADAIHYAYALALAKNNQAAEALPVIEALIKKDPSQKLFYLEKAALLSQTHQSAAALTILSKLYTVYSNDQPVLNDYIHALLQGNSSEKKQALDILKNNPGDDPNYYALLSKAQDANKNILAAYTARVTMFQLRDDPESAIAQLQSELRLPSLTLEQKNNIRDEIKDLQQKRESSHA